VTALLQAVAGPQDGLEHVYAQPSGPGVGVVLFLIAPGQRAAEATARSLFNRSCEAGLSGYRLVRCRAELLPGLPGRQSPTE
jgi:hypothetical protein